MDMVQVPVGPMSGSSVLVVEDDDDVLSLLSTHLTTLGCQVSRASSGEDGLRRALADPPDVIIIDVVLPGMNGLELALALRDDARTRKTRLVMTSVMDREDLVEIQHSCGTDAILPKPFSRRDVAAALGPWSSGAGS